MKNILYLITICVLSAGFAACSNDEDNPLKNDYLKRTTSPLIVGEKIEFVYAMGGLEGKLKMAYAEASIAGAAGTDFEPYTWHTLNGSDYSIMVARDCLTEGNLSSAHIIDAQSTSLRYYYVIPEDARGKDISFTFSCESAATRHSSIKTDTYRISEMDMRARITVVGTDEGERYFSIEDMKAYTRDEVETGNLSSKIDFIYAYSATKTVGGNVYDYKHAFFSPSSTGYYPDGFSLPSTWKLNETLMDKKLNVWDGQLRGDGNTNIYVDDIDLKSQSFDNSVDYVLDIRADGGVFMKTQDGKYTAFIYINSITDASTAVIGIKRYKH